MVFAGDFNVGEALERRQALLGMRLPNDRVAVVQDALHSCAERERLGLTRMDGEAHRALDRGKDWQFFRSGSMATIAANAIRVPFGREPDRSMLSDHIGYTAIYRLFARPVPGRLSA